MRRHPLADEVDLPNLDEIEAALNAAIDRPLDDLMAIEEFAEKLGPPEAPVVEATDADEAEEAGPATLPLVFPEEQAEIHKAA